MTKLRLQHFIAVGLLFWGLLAAVVAGTSAVVLAGTSIFTMWVVAVQRNLALSPGMSSQHTGSRVAVICAVAAGYLLLDAMFGRQKFSQNVFLSASALELVIEKANEDVSQGRGVVDLLGGLMPFMGFALFDAARRAGSAGAAMRMLAILLLFYDAGISRGFVLIAALAIVLGHGINTWRLLAGGAAAAAVFVLASTMRGDYSEVIYGNPFIDALVVPIVNLALFLENDCGASGATAFLGEFFKKFIPSFVMSKEIFSFNIEMTKCIYPFFGDIVPSISIFTYLGEYYYYGPPLVTAALAGVVLGLLCRVLENQLQAADLRSTRVFAGLMCVVLLRSRVQDVFSFLIFLLIFLVCWQFVLPRGATAHVIQPGERAGDGEGSNEPQKGPDQNN